MLSRRLLLAALPTLAAGTAGAQIPPPLDLPEARLWALLKAGQHAAFIRHADAPGTGDPPGFRLEECATQRNLSELGRAQARALGDLFRRRGIEAADLRSSRWCRCLETAELMGLGPVKRTPALDSLFGRRDQTQTQMIALLDVLLNHQIDTKHKGKKEPLVLVTHQVNITAVSRIFPQPGEIVVVEFQPDYKFQVAGTIAPPQV